MGKVRTLAICFRDHRAGAKRRGIPFELTFEQWLTIWQDSGHLHERGVAGHQYVMARKGDKGPYSVSNVKIVTAKQNHEEKVMPDQARTAIRLSKQGRHRTSTVKKRIAFTRRIKKINKLTRGTALKIRCGSASRSALAKKYKVCVATIRNIQIGQTWKY